MMVARSLCLRRNPVRLPVAVLRNTRLILFGALIVSVSVQTSFAWGPEGHRIVARVAELRLKPKAKAALEALIPGEHLSDNYICNWPDYVRNDEPETGPWHYVDIPYDAKAYDAARDCPDGQCIVAQIKVCAASLADRKASAGDRRRALCFLVHFVGDLHQPLHCVSRDDDRGGNLRTIRYPGQLEDTNLHSVWDASLVHANLQGQDPIAYADGLNATIAFWPAYWWSRGTVAGWAWEGREAAVQYVYAGVPPTGGPAFALGEDYIVASRRVVNRQLMKGGVRLAAVLNHCLR